MNTTHNPPPEHDIMQAQGNQLIKVSKILASAFADDPIFNWFSGHPPIYATLFRAEIEALYKHHNHVYINREGTGAATWLPAGVSTEPPFHWRSLQAFWKLASTGGMNSLQRGTRLLKIMADHFPGEPYFYLHAVGASAGNQGRGIGSALLKTGLRECDQQGLPAYLESTNERNNPLYERYGFAVINEVQLPDNCPSLWLMRREARPLC